MITLTNGTKVYLDSIEQETFKMHRESRLTYKQIAEEKNILVKTVEKKMSQALKRIRFGIEDALMPVLMAHYFVSSNL